MDALGLMPEQMHDTRYPALLAKAVKFLETEPNWKLTVAKLVHGKPMFEPLKVLAEYADVRAALAWRQDEVQSAADALEKLKLVVDPAHPEALAAQERFDAAQGALQSIYAEARIYEK
jgi:hypothetical protein